MYSLKNTEIEASPGTSSVVLNVAKRLTIPLAAARRELKASERSDTEPI